MYTPLYKWLLKKTIFNITFIILNMVKIIQKGRREKKEAKNKNEKSEEISKIMKSELYN